VSGSALPASAAEAPARRASLERALLTLLLALIRLYQLTLSPFVGRFCRFEPTCSRYTQEALRRHGHIRGSILGAGRICRCRPYGGSGYDPVPD
jgi:putative membrane protein insertion efficiency factor